MLRVKPAAFTDLPHCSNEFQGSGLNLLYCMNINAKFDFIEPLRGCLKSREYVVFKCFMEWRDIPDVS